jgi:DNA-binding response OmpR family regulator
VSKRILLIDSDEAFAQGLSNAMNARGFSATMATNSEQGMTLAKQDSPDLIVVCVEAQPTNGYMLCTRLKKDDALKGIPVILTSANATPDSFEKHKKLKTRAEEYLIKPFEPRVMLEKASALLGVPLLPEESEEILTMEDEPLGLGDLVAGEDEPIRLSEHDALQAHTGEITIAEESVEVEEVVSVDEHPSDHDDDLEMFDQAFDSLGAQAAATSDSSTERFSGLRLAPDPDAGSPPPPPHEEGHEQEQHAQLDAQPTELTAPDDDAVLHGLLHEGEGGAEPQFDAAHFEAGPGGLGNEAQAALEARVAELEQQLAERDAELELAKRSAGSAGDLQKLKEAKNRNDKEVFRLKEELHAKEKELMELQELQTSLEGQSQQLRDDSVKREAAAKALQQRADALAAAAKKFERELSSAREELKQSGALKSKVGELEKAHEELKKKHLEAAAETDKHRARAEQLEAELAGTSEVHSEQLESARADAEKARADHAALRQRTQQHTDELSQHKGELETTRHELAGVRAELEAARAELETVHTDVTALTGEKDLLGEERDELRRKLSEEQARASQNEERAVKAYQKIKGDEKLREKTRKALQIALQLLEEGAETADAHPEPAKQSA